MKFYYNGKLVRTSKTRTYTHAVMHNSYCASCASSYELAEKAMNAQLSQIRANLDFYKAALEATKSGKRSMIRKPGGRTVKVTLDQTAEEYAKMVEWAENFMNGWEVVELEARA